MSTDCSLLQAGLTYEFEVTARMVIMVMSSD